MQVSFYVPVHYRKEEISAPAAETETKLKNFMADNYLLWRRGYQIVFFTLYFGYEFPKFQKKESWLRYRHRIENTKFTPSKDNNGYILGA